VEREVKVWEREEPRGTGKYFAITSRELPSQQSDAWRDGVESSVFLD
jgi:hypothetical protein